MLFWILATLALYVVQTMLPNTFRFSALDQARRGPELVKALGPRDEMPALGVRGERAIRAQTNLQEALPVFLTLALIHLLRPAAPSEMASMGAGVFFVARVIYVPTYLYGVFGLRSAVWAASWIGLLMMIAALF